MIRKKFETQISSGFTIIEVLTVISIIGILAAIVVVSFPKVRQGAKDSKREADVRSLAGALEDYFSDKHIFPGTPGSYSYSTDTDFMDTLAAEDYIKSKPIDPINSSTYRYTYYISKQGDANNRASDGSDYGLCAPLEGQKTGSSIYYKSGVYYFLNCSDSDFCTWFWNHDGCKTLALSTCAGDSDDLTGVCCPNSACRDYQGRASDCAAGTACCSQCVLPTCASLGGACCPSNRCNSADNLGATSDCNSATEKCCSNCQPPDCERDFGYTCCPSANNCGNEIVGTSGCLFYERCCQTCSIPSCVSLGGTCCVNQLGYSCNGSIAGSCGGTDKCCSTCIPPCSIAGGTCCDPSSICVSPKSGNCTTGSCCTQCVPIVTLATDTVIGSSNTFDNKAIIINSGVIVTIHGIHNFVSIVNNGTILITSYNGTAGTGSLSITADTITNNGTIEGSGRGYGGGGGGGTGTYEYHAGSGGNAYGGGGGGGAGGTNTAWPGYCPNGGTGGVASGGGQSAANSQGGCGVNSWPNTVGGNGNAGILGGKNICIACGGGGGGGGGSFAGIGGNYNTTTGNGNLGFNGGYLTSEANGDTSTDVSAQIGSGGGGGAGSSQNDGCPRKNGVNGISGEGFNGALPGGGGNGSVSWCGQGGAGGGGGGAGGASIQLLASQTITNTGTIKSNGSKGGNGGVTSWRNGGKGGDGAGGGIVLKANTINLQNGTITSLGGNNATINGGTIKLLSTSISGTMPTLAGRVYH